MNERELIDLLVKALEAQKPEGDYESDDELQSCVTIRREALDEVKKFKK